MTIPKTVQPSLWQGLMPGIKTSYSSSALDFSVLGGRSERDTTKQKDNTSFLLIQTCLSHRQICEHFLKRSAPGLIWYWDIMIHISRQRQKSLRSVQQEVVSHSSLARHAMPSSARSQGSRSKIIILISVS